MPDLMDPNPALPVPPLEPYDDYSRYRGLDLQSAVDASGRAVVVVARRFLPQPESLAQVGMVTVKAADRLDIIAAQQMDDARWWWRIADANGAIDPSELTADPGTSLRLTLPQGMTLPRG